MNIWRQHRDSQQTLGSKTHSKCACMFLDKVFLFTTFVKGQPLHSKKKKTTEARDMTCHTKVMVLIRSTSLAIPVAGLGLAGSPFNPQKHITFLTMNYPRSQMGRGFQSTAIPSPHPLCPAQAILECSVNQGMRGHGPGSAEAPFSKNHGRTKGRRRMGHNGAGPLRPFEKYPPGPGKK